jgi:UDP-glucose 4-epimerase
MKLVVTGPLGHIGSALIRVLPADRISELVLIDDLSTQRYSSLFNLPSSIPTQFVEGDVCTMDLAPHFDNASLVIHLAALTDAANSVDRRDAVFRVNVAGTERVAGACIAAGAGMLFLSTTSVYGTQASVVDEEAGEDVLRPQSPYAESKVAAEKLLAGMDELQFAILRLGTIFGPSPGIRFHTAINKFVWQACTGIPLTIWETALHQVRPYLHIDDAVRALLLMSETGRLDRRVYNVLTTNASVGQIVDVIRTFVPALEQRFVESPIMNQLSFEVAAPRIAQLGFTATGTLEDGIARTVSLLRGLNAR